MREPARIASSTFVVSSVVAMSEVGRSWRAGAGAAAVVRVVAVTDVVAEAAAGSDASRDTSCALRQLGAHDGGTHSGGLLVEGGRLNADEELPAPRGRTLGVLALTNSIQGPVTAMVRSAARRP